MSEEKLDKLIAEMKELKGLLEVVLEQEGGKRLLSINEACDYLNIGRTEGYAKLRLHVQGIKHGKRILFEKADLDRLIDRAKKTGVLFN